MSEPLKVLCASCGDWFKFEPDDPQTLCFKCWLGLIKRTAQSVKREIGN
jgi:hypothetical protein